MALLSANDCCIGEKLENLIAKTCHFVISDIIKKIDFREFVVTSQGNEDR